MTTLHQFVRRFGPRRASRRRGTVLILALGVLAILSIAALSYVTVVRLDRAGVTVTAQRGSFESQANIVVGHLRDVITADLFGNKIVTPEVPPIVGGVRNWPSMFEDGDARDAATIDLSTFNTALAPLDAPSAASILASGERARPDDAFLASTEPRWEPNADLTFRWPQITNLNSAYRYDNRSTPAPSDDRWVRGDGRFIDLAEWFLSPVNQFADPSINLRDWSAVTLTGQIDALDGVNQDVYNRQINDMSGGLQTLGAILPSDERQWVDTDGDLRPDSRWTTLDSLSGQGGLKWVVAARIIDASAFANVNASVEFGGLFDYAVPANLGDGRTPADVDIARLFKNATIDTELATTDGLYQYDIATDRLFQNDVSFSSHLVEALGLGRIIEDTNTAITPPLTNFIAWQDASPSTPAHRFRYWRYFGQSPTRPDPLGRRGGGYPIRDLVDLAAFWGTNNPSIVSWIEQHIDGTESDGYLPNDMRNFFGPLRAKEQAAEARRLITTGESVVPDARPTGRRVKESIRRVITPVSGSGLQGPVPVLNPATSFQGSYRTEKVRIDAAPATTADTERLARETFQSLVWALAPSATDQPLNWAASIAGAGGGFSIAGEDAHYGGYSLGESGPGYRSLARHLYPPNPPAFPSIANPLATFPIVTAASMAANLIDALDAVNPGVVEAPTVVALYNSVTPPGVGAHNAIPLGTRLPQGDIPAGSLPWIDPGDPYLVVGVDRQPFLREVTTVALFTDYDPDRPGVGTDYQITGTADEALGSAVIVVLHNPWPNPITVGPEYAVVIPEGYNDGAATPTPQFIDDPGTAAVEAFRMVLPVATIPQDGTAAFIWVLNPSGSEPWNNLEAEISAASGYGAPIFVVPNASITPAPDMATNRIPFLALAQTQHDRGVLLTFQRDRVSASDPELILDRMLPPEGEKFPLIFNVGATAFDFAADGPANYPAGFGQNWFELELGYDAAALAADTRFTNGQISGRYMFTSCLSRPAVRRDLNSFSATVIEHRSKNNVTHRSVAHGWMMPVNSNDDSIVNDDVIRDSIDAILSSSVPGATIFPGSHLAGAGAALTFADTSNPYGASGADLPAFNLFVPNTGLKFASDMLRIGIYAHTCKDALANVTSLTHWRTASEKLGASVNYFYGDALVSATPNSYLGVLDPTRYVPGAAGDLFGYANMPDTMRIPLALRVPDCFEAAPISPTSTLVQGRINLNTAPRQVIDVLPLVRPEYAVPDTGGFTGIPASRGRADLIEAYRDPAQGNGTFEHVPSGTILNRANLPQGMRPDDPTSGPNSATSVRHATHGFATPAELAVLGQWDVTLGPLNGRPVDMQPGTFLEVGADTFNNNFAPIQEHRETGVVPSIATDGPAERLALYRAVSNIATTRSDVFICWFVLRGYDPQTIERIQLPSDNPSENQVIAAMDNPDNGFVPVHESRWLVVLDRSQTDSGAPIRLPTDRPRVLLQVQLPSVRP